ncbi:hypothetical protein YPPY12_4303, partial [Yersinia pestis PY-12]
MRGGVTLCQHHGFSLFRQRFERDKRAFFAATGDQLFRAIGPDNLCAGAVPR